MGDVDPTGDRTWRGDNQPKVYFADLRHEVELAARRHAELSEHADEIVAERDRLRAELHEHLSTAADAVEAIDQEKAAVEIERDRLRAVVHAACNELDDIGAQSGWGSIGLVVERLVREFELEWYPLRSRREWETLRSTEATDG